MISFRANGKLLLTGEYAVLDGAVALALPAKLGQTLDFEPGQDGLHWRSYDADGACWFEAHLESPSFSLRHSSDTAIGARLSQILQTTQGMNSRFTPEGRAVTRLEFSRHWGLGTSSTLIANIATWAGVDAFELLEKTFGGSGYDVACATAGGPLLFQRRQGKPHFLEIPFDPPFAEQLYFVYLGQKQDSREGIRRYRARAAAANKTWIDAISHISMYCAAVSCLQELELLLRQHEGLITGVLDLPAVQSALFPDYWGAVKSLGAWGGDFVLATSDRGDEATRAYFRDRGLSEVLSYGELIL